MHLSWFSLLHFLPVGVALVVIGASVRRRKQAPIPALITLAIMTAVWALFQGLEYAVQSIELKVLFARFQYIGIVHVPLLFFLFILRYTQEGSMFLTPRRIFLLEIIPVVSLGLVFTNELHHLIWTEITPITTAFGEQLRFGHGIAFYVLVVYGYLLNVTATLYLIWTMLRAPHLYRDQAATMFLGIIFPWMANALYITGSLDKIGLDPTPLAFSISGVLFFWTIFRLRLFEFSPIGSNAILNSLDEAVLVLDLHDRLVDMNNPAMSLLKLDRKGVIGLPVTRIFDHWPKVTTLFAKNDSAQEIAEITPGEYFEIDVNRLATRGGQPTGRVIVLRNVTERKHYEMQMRLLGTALEAAANGIVITDQAGVIVWVNHAFTEMSGYSKDELLGQTPNIQKSGAHDEVFYKNMWDVLMSGRVWFGEVINRRKDGALYTEEQMITPLRGETGKIENFIAVKQDISERKGLEKLRDDLVYTIVHDLRNPLTSITMALDVIDRSLRRKYDLPIEQIDMMEIARSNTRRMAGLVNAILDINRMENERMPLNKAMVLLHKLVGDAMKFQQTMAIGKGLDLRNEVPEELPDVFVDVGMIGRVFQNLIDNAIKFTPEGGTIRVSAESSNGDGFFLVAVSDTGPGIPPDVQTRLFQKFASGSEAGHGTGLGLAFCRLVVEAHGGQIWAETADGQGTTFRFTLPAPDADIVSLD